jgi:ABC-type transport system substrate-binding protein
MMNDAKLISDPQERADAWAEIDKKLTELAPAVNWVWDKTPLIRSENVNAVPSAFLGQWDLSFTSIK